MIFSSNLIEVVIDNQLEKGLVDGWKVNIMMIRSCNDKERVHERIPIGLAHADVVESYWLVSSGIFSSVDGIRNLTLLLRQ